MDTRTSPQRILAATATAAALTLLFAGCNPSGGSQNHGASTTSVKVAFNVPLTGPFGIYGQTIRDGATLAKEDLANGTVKFDFDVQDNTGTANGAVSALQKQAAGEPTIYVSGVKPQTMAIFDQVNSKGWPYFVWVFDAFITSKSPNVFRTWTNYKYEPRKYLQYVQFRKAKSVAIACVNMPHTTEEFNQLVVPALNKIGVKSTEEIYDFDTKNYRDIVLKLSKNKPDLYILNGFQENLIGLVRALRSYNLVGDGNVIGTYDLLDAANILAKPELEGLRVIAPAFNLSSDPKIAQWRTKFKNRYNRDPLYTDAYSYDMISIIADAGKRLKLPATSSQWIDALSKTSMDGITGPILFDNSRDLILSLKIGVYRDGRLVQDNSEGSR